MSRFNIFLQMRLLLTIDPSKRGVVAKFFAVAETEKPAEDGTLVITALIEPHDYRDVDQAVKDIQGKVEVLVHAVKPESDHKFEKDEDD